jgi:hypothetical protein
MVPIPSKKEMRLLRVTLRAFQHLLTLPFLLDTFRRDYYLLFLCFSLSLKRNKKQSPVLFSFKIHISNPTFFHCSYSFVSPFLYLSPLLAPFLPCLPLSLKVLSACFSDLISYYISFYGTYKTVP